MAVDDHGDKRVFQRLGASNGSGKQQKVCHFWAEGRCNRYPCPYLHRDLPGPPPHQHRPFISNGSSSRQPNQGVPENPCFSGGRRNPTWVRDCGGGSGIRAQDGGAGNRVFRKIEKLCNYWLRGNCSYGDKCKFLHSWTVGDCFSSLAKLEGHQKVICGIALPSGSDKLYTGSKDETLRIWDCQSGQCTGVVNLGGEVGCMISEGPWLFVGIPNVVKAWNTQNNAEFSLNGPVGQVYALVVGNDLLFAGVQDGAILAWKFNAVSNCFEPTASLKGHTRSVVSLVVGANKLFSGSMDNSIRVWSIENLQCLHTLTEHNAVVMSLLCWDQFLLSCSLDGTIKVWVQTDNGNIEVTYTHTEEEGVLYLCGMHDSEGKPVLLCSHNDNDVVVYDLPSFGVRGKIFGKEEIRKIVVGPEGLVFTGDGSGEVKVWRWINEKASPPPDDDDAAMNRCGKRPEEELGNNSDRQELVCRGGEGSMAM